MIKNLQEAISIIEKKFGYKIDYDHNYNVYLLWYSNDPNKPSNGRMIETHEIYAIAKESVSTQDKQISYVHRN